MQIPDALVNEVYGDRYFDVVDAVDEARNLYCRGTALAESLTAAAADGRPLRIGELGFGAGRLFCTTLDFIDKNNPAGCSVDYYSVELHPLSPARIAAILEPFKPELGPLMSGLLEQYRHEDLTAPGWHRFSFPRPCFRLSLNLWIGEALDMVKALETTCDIWFLDGHAPKKNPQIWRHELLLEVGRKTIPGGRCATFTVAGFIRRSLVEAGFVVRRVPGFGGKKEVLQGIKLS